MPKVIYYVAASLDGFIATEDNSLDWLMQFGFEAFQEHYDRFMAGVGAVVMGAETYRWIRREEPDSWAYHQPCWVLSHSPGSGPVPPNVRFAAGDIRATAREAADAAGGGNIWVVGGGNVAAQFAAAGLLDELWITYMPVALGSGRPLLPISGPTAPMQLIAVTQFDGGAAELRYALR